LILTVNTYLFKYVPVKLGFIILSLIGVLRIPEEFYLYKDKDNKFTFVSYRYLICIEVDEANTGDDIHITSIK
jgi:hypothetical protein